MKKCNLFILRNSLPEVFYKTDVLKSFAKIRRNTSVLESLFNKVVDLKIY